MNNYHKWLEIKPLVKHLSTSVRSIYELKSAGLLKPGIHFYAAGASGKKGKHVYELELVRKVLLEQTAKAAQLKAQSESIQPVESYDEEQIEELIRRSQL